MKNQKEILNIHKLIKIFKGDVGVKDISFSVGEGEIFGFLGPNGAGKSTTIKMMLDIIKPDSGMISIFGKSVKDHSIDIRKSIGYLPGEFQAFDGLTGGEFLDLSMNIKQKQYDIYPLLDRLALDKSALKRKIKNYSQGMKQKLGLINAIASDPKLLILDEPSTGLDPIIQYELYDILRSCAAKGTTVLFSSHNLPEVERICDRVAVIREGKIVIVASLEELRRKRKTNIFLTLKNSQEELYIQGAKIISKNNNKYHIEVENDINEVIHELNELEILDLIIPEPSLEEIFKSYYEKQ